MARDVGCRFCMRILGEGRGVGNSPIPHRKTHNIANHNHRHHRLTAQLPIRIDAVADGQLQPNHVRETDDAHCEYQAEPVHTLRGAHAPQYETTGDEKGGEGEEPETVFRVHDAVVSPR